MPTTTRSRTSPKSSSVLERELGFGALGAGIAPGLPGDDRSERERAEIGAGRPRRGAPAADPLDRRPLTGELIDEAVESAAGRRRLRQALGVPSDRRISDAVIDELLAAWLADAGVTLVGMSPRACTGERCSRRSRTGSSAGS